MIPIERHIRVRSARDRLIDMLGLGETYPVQDVVVQGEQLTVLFNHPSVFDINPGQVDVRYELFEGNVPVGAPYFVVGNGGESVLNGPLITVNRIFRFRGSKIDASGKERPGRQAFLHQQVEVKVGLNTKLNAWIRDPNTSQPLFPPIIDYGSTAQVTIEGAQAEADYQLVYTNAAGALVFTEPLHVEVGGNITLETNAIQEDTQIRIHVTKTFEPSENRPNLSEYLEVTLPLSVRANPVLAVSIDGSPLVDPVGPVGISIEGSQQSVVYSAYVRTLGDADFDIDNLLGADDAITLHVPASLDVPEHDVRVRRPPRPVPWQVQSGYAQQGDSKQGNGGKLTLMVGQLHEDSVVVIQARKSHPSKMPLQSALQLAQAVVALSRPDPALGLGLTLSPVDGTRGTLLVSGGQAGVFYTFRRTGEPTLLGLPAYFHRMDEVAPQQNRGLAQLRIGMDFVLTRDPPLVPPDTDLATLPPLEPLVEITPLPVDGTLHVMAIKARTGVAWQASRVIPATQP
ncbi:hypothetical protein [Vitiosangium sp. GDMCC 1.1324]|uniref:hypothetical protein n=1 Tax=Vitiosangium sp. (strain GDMCC 1.1324) TaxID=2138576 RepID=UPI000D3541B3|nr:hypothetical protein [Vitiosangium sp. GDMCC 1.1324]PTL78101.1 hypothetical protein DAT35_41545 [Vitiosangium sp. GDMCC 1.1324]